MNCFLELLVLHVVRIVALVDIGSELVHKLLLYTTVSLYFLVGELDGLEHIVLAYLIHLSLNHHNVLLGCSDHEFEVGVLHLGEARVDYKLTVYPAHAHLGNRTAEREVGSGEGAGSCESGKCVRLYILLCGYKGNVDEDLEVEIIRPERTDRSVDKSGYEDLIVTGLAFPLHETAREASC